MIGENLRKAPLIRVVIPFGAGIFMGTMFQNSISLNMLILSLLISSFILLTSYKISQIPEFRWIFGLALLFCLILLGLIYEHMCRTRNFLNVPQSKGKYYQLKITEHVKVNEEWNVFYADCLAERDDTCWNRIAVRVQLYLVKKQHFPSFSPGDKLIIRANVVRTSQPVNPGEFNYQKFLDRKGIWGSVYLKDSASVIQIERAQWFSPERLAFVLQDKFLSVFRKVEIKGDELALLSALTIGVRDQIDNEINKAFAASGAMHILSVSGLHVGIVYLVFARLLSLIGRNRYSRVLSVILQIAFLWFYAFLTGLSPAVNRAAAMFSFLALGKLLNRSASSLNIVSGSGLVLLLFNPFLIFDMGFQLSYLAVISIFLFQSFIYNLIDFKNYLADQVWKLTALSLAAQIGTFPLSIIYFHQFPNYFILTNLLVVPLAAIILYLSIAMVILFWVPYLSSVLAWLLKYSLKGMILSVMQVEHLPFSVIHDISIAPFQLILLYIIILLFAFFIQLRIRSYFFACVSAFAIFIISLIATELISYRNQFFIVFQQRGSSLMMAGSRSSAFVLYSGKNPKLPLQAIKLSKGVCLDRKIKAIQLYCIDSLGEGSFYSINNSLEMIRKGKRVYINNGNQHIIWLEVRKMDKITFYDSAKPDVLVIARLMKVNDREALKPSCAKRIVFDSSCKASLIKEKSALFAKEGPMMFDVNSSGAFSYGN
jgi:competence protein ComEC